MLALWLLGFVVFYWLVIQAGRFAWAVLNIVAMFAVLGALVVLPFTALFMGGKKSLDLVKRAWGLRRRGRPAR